MQRGSRPRICDDASVSSVIAAAGAALLLGASALGRTPLGVALVVVQVALVLGWCKAAEPGARIQLPGAVVAIAAAVAADVALLRVHPATDVRALAGVLAALVGLAFAVQLGAHVFGRNPRSPVTPGLTPGLTAAVAAGAVAVIGAGWLGERAGRGGAQVIAVALVAAGVAVLGVQPRVPDWVGLPLGLAAGIGAGLLVATARAAPTFSTSTAAAIAAVAATIAVAARSVARMPAGSPRTTHAATAALPLLVVAPAVLVVARVLID